MIVRRRLLLSGRVQGVFFRDMCRKLAQLESITGYARNLPDGRLEVCLEGELHAIGRVVEWCRDGPPLAEVESVDVLDEIPEGLKGFAIS